MKTLLACLGVLCLADAAGAQEPPAAPAREFALRRITQPPVLDGVLDDHVWQQPPLPLTDWISYQPLYGDKIAQRTTVWAAYDARYLYFAFQCDDPEPGKIKTGIRRRDNSFHDDWVGLSLDSLGTRQSTYDMFVNPSGMQMDILTSSSSGEELAPDWVWESAGQINATGYVVEMRVPLQSVRFRGGPQVRMGILFWRRISRLGASVAWPDLPPGKSIFERHATMLLQDLKEQRTREIIPSATYALNQNRESAEQFGGLGTQGDVGLSAKYGITSAMTLDATVNPDFSQVESDAFQVEVNQRFPVFFSEKRPFFMEGNGIFALAGSGQGDGNMATAVHTRRVVDPIFGVKLTGTAGRFTFGTLSAADQSPGRAFDGGAVNPHPGRDRWFNVARAQYSLGPGNYVGALVTDTEFAGGSNRVIGSDISMRLGANQRFGAAALHTRTDPVGAGAGAASPEAARQGSAVQASYFFGTRRAQVITFGEYYDRDFQMDTAFYNRTHFTSGWTYGDLNFYPDKKKYPAIRRIVPFVFTQYGYDRGQRGSDRLFVPGIRLHFSRQGFFRVDHFFGHEPWAGGRYRLDRTRVQGQVQALKWLNIGGQTYRGFATFYDPIAPFQGRTVSRNVNVQIQPTPQITQQIGFTYVHFERADSGAKVYDVRIVNTRSTYQFSKYFFVRGIVQYDGRRQRVLTDLLGSYELRPGTVVYAGYGSLLEEGRYEGESWHRGEGEYVTRRRGLFFKASYLYRF